MKKSYSFYGWEKADESPADRRYEGIKNPRELYDILSEIWCRKTCAPRLQNEWTEENRTLGQCSITAFLAQDIFGGNVMGVRRPGGNYHCFNEVAGHIFDLTSEQFGSEKLDYSEAVPQSPKVHFAKEEKRKRYEYLKNELNKSLKYVYGTAENKQYLAQQARELISFGRKFPDKDGASFWLDSEGNPVSERDRETWITARMAHVYSVGTILQKERSVNTPFSGEIKEILQGTDLPENILSREDCAFLAERAVHGLLTVLQNKEQGGWYAAVTSDGNKKGPMQCYAHAFVMLASSSAYLAGIPESAGLMKKAEEIYDRYFWNEEEGLSCDSWDEDFKHRDSYRGLNGNMHSVEAFLAISDATGNEKYRKRAGRIISRVITWASENNWRIPEHFSEKWEPELSFNSNKKDDQFKPYGATPGHGIEWARLITQWALSAGSKSVINKEEENRYIGAAEKLYMRAYEDGWNADGAPGFVYTTGWDGKPVVHDRMHWTLAEAINTSSVLYRVTGNEMYSDHYRKYMKYLDKYVTDHEKGSWFHQLDRMNRPTDTVWPGKPDIYHAFQAMLIPYLDPEISIAAAAAGKRIS